VGHGNGGLVVDQVVIGDELQVRVAGAWDAVTVGEIPLHLGHAGIGEVGVTLTEHNGPVDVDVQPAPFGLAHDTQQVGNGGVGGQRRGGQGDGAGVDSFGAGPAGGGQQTVDAGPRPFGGEHGGGGELGAGEGLEAVRRGDLHPVVDPVGPILDD